jgi:hypothetical protein
MVGKSYAVEVGSPTRSFRNSPDRSPNDGRDDVRKQFLLQGLTGWQKAGKM